MIYLVIIPDLHHIAMLLMLFYHENVDEVPRLKTLLQTLLY